SSTSAASAASKPSAKRSNAARSSSSPSSLPTTPAISSSSGSTSTPPGAASIRTSRPPTTRCSPPSCQRFARSGPKRRKRSVEKGKSYGSGIGRTGIDLRSALECPQHVVQVLERLVGPALAFEVLGESGAGEDPLGAEG